MAGRARLYAVATRAALDCRPPAALGTAARTGEADAGSGLACRFGPAANHRHACCRAKPVWPVTGPTAREPLGARHPLPGTQKGRVRLTCFLNTTPHVTAGQRGAVLTVVKSLA